MRLSLILALLAGPAIAGDPVATLEGIGNAKDGGDILFGKVSVRLNGVAAPEYNEPGGAAATAMLGSLVDGQKVTCLLDGSTANGRPVGACFVNGEDVGEALIEAGKARDCPRYSAGRYAAAEAKARAKGADLSGIYPLPNYCE